jgi:peptide chain release factor 1
VDDVEIDIPDSDIEIEVYRSSGAGGQTQKNSAAVRIHLADRHGDHLRG